VPCTHSTRRVFRVSFTGDFRRISAPSACWRQFRRGTIYSIPRQTFCQAAVGILGWGNLLLGAERRGVGRSEENRETRTRRRRICVSRGACHRAILATRPAILAGILYRHAGTAPDITDFASGLRTLCSAKHNIESRVEYLPRPRPGGRRQNRQ
jgi:hypothetical protein